MYDCEIFAAIPQQGVVRDPRLYYCGGWEDYDGMGISVVTAYDFVEAEYKVYLSDNLDEFKTLTNSRQILIGFNNKKFDDNLLKANNFIIPSEKSYDMFLSIVNTQPPGERKGFSLNDLLKANGLSAKTGLGSEAPFQAQTGQWGKLINYCLTDTKKQVQILRLAGNGLLKNPKNNGFMTVKMPWEEKKIDEGGIFV